MAVYAPARLNPSRAESVACALGDVVTLGPRIAITGKPGTWKRSVM